MSLEKFSAMLLKDLGKTLLTFPEVYDAADDLGKLEVLVMKLAEETGVRRGGPIEVPDNIKDLTLNRNMAAKGREDKYFLTTEDELISPITGEFYIEKHGLKFTEANAMARAVIPEYMPRHKAGVSRIKLGDKQVHDVFNTYIPADWTTYPKKKSLPDRLPDLFLKLVNHLFPIPLEREYFYAWLHESMFRRAYVYLILCGAPGTGKNRLKLVLRALHGHDNTVDGKKSTLVERFNSQLSGGTLGWFDELYYDLEMENVMKELQNDSISIERKGVDATRATKIHSSLVISNNKPRDNYLAFDARKFAPLVVTSRRLEQSMSSEEIDELSRKVEDATKPEFDIEFIAQIAMWIKRHGKSTKWPNLEYRGPMFWSLAHTSMSRWQKKAAMLIIDSTARPQRAEFDEVKGYLWSSMAEKSQRKNGDRSMQFPDHTSVMFFFDTFRDSKGRKAFTTKKVDGSILGDFWVKPLFKHVAIVTETTLMETREKEASGKRKEKLDL